METLPMTNLSTAAEELLAQAKEASSRRALTQLLPHECDHKQLLLALAAGAALSEHDNPGDATLLVLRGDVTLSTQDESYRGTAGSHLVIPNERHDLRATEDSVVLLSFVKATP